jgi:hypothetical protein
MTDPIDDMIGGADTPQDEIDEICKQIASGRGSFVDAGDTKRPVTQNFLALAFDMDSATVKKRLLRVKPVGYGGTTKQPRALYDFKEACSYLVEPKIDLDAYIRSIDPNKLPNHINKMYWEARRTRLRFELDAGQAWRSEDVLEVFGTVFMLIKDRVQLWSETMREAVKLSDEQFARFTQMTDDLQNSLHSELVAIPESRSTPSMAAAVEGAGDE